MAKLSEAQAGVLRDAANHPSGYVNTHTTNKRTLDALRSRFLIKPEGGSAVITPSGRAALDAHERAEKAKQEQKRRLALHVPAGAFVEPSARTAPVLGLEYDEDEPDEAEVKQAAPAVQLTPRPNDVEQEASDAEILQILVMLDHGVIVARSLYQEYGVVGAPACFSLDVDKLNRAARDAVRFGLARQTYAERLYRLEPEPVHLLTEPMQATPCGRYPEAARKSGKRLRVTADPARITHDFCK